MHRVVLRRVSEQRHLPPKPDNLSSISRTHMIKGEYLVPQIFICIQ